MGAAHRISRGCPEGGFHGETLFSTLFRPACLPDSATDSSHGGIGVVGGQSLVDRPSLKGSPEGSVPPTIRRSALPSRPCPLVSVYRRRRSSSRRTNRTTRRRC